MQLTGNVMWSIKKGQSKPKREAMLAKDFKKLTHWVDYDRPLLPSLTKNQQIIYLEKRLKKVVLIPIRELYASLMKDKKRSSTVLCFGTCVCCSIEALGKFYTGKVSRGNSGPNFRAFVKAYMSPDFLKKLDGSSYVNLLWKNFRNGLAHGFAIKRGGFEQNSSYFQVKVIDGIKQLEIDPSHFYQDFVNSISKYICDLKTASPSDTLYLEFKKAFDAVFIKGL
jgi:hypothetical protein